MASTDMSPTEMLRKAESDLAARRSAAERLRAEAATANAAAAEADQDADRMESTVAWLRSAIGTQEHSPITTSGGQAQRFGKPVPDTANTDLCIDGLVKLGGRAKTVPIREYLARQGHNLTQEQVRGSLKYLSKKKPAPVVMVGPGEWAIAPGVNFKPFEPARTPALNGAGRGVMT